MWTRALLEPLNGKTPLWKVVWIYGFGVSVLYSVFGLVLAPETPLAIGIYGFIGLALGVVQSLMLWKCAYNSRFPSAGRVLRIAVVAGLLLLPLMLYVLVRYPEAMLSPG
jgi:hypothetical protein